MPTVTVTMPGTLSATLNSSLGVTAQFTDTGYSMGTSYTSIINWGDGSNSSGTVSTSPPQGSTLQGSVQGSHVYSTVGTFTVSLGVNAMHMMGGGNTTTTATATVTVTAPNQPPAVTNPGAQASAEGATASLQIQATDPDGDPLTFSASGLPAGLSISTGGLVSGTVDYSAAETNGGSYSVSVTATDSHGAGASQTFTWSVTDTNRPPSSSPLARRPTRKATMWNFSFRPATPTATP
ncbi:MAG TPA: putative Ig domain-containing protein [Gemmataceae bacterium]|nr:putative Ig domain-containing protein [Gemmataceae bacterium]